MNLDIETTVRTLFVFLIIAFILMGITAFRAFREAARLRFFLKKRELLSRAWKFVFFSIFIITAAFLINSFAETIVYRVFPPSPTATLVPTMTQIPTETITPTITLTPTITNTPEITPTPIMPAVISQEFTSQITPNPNARFSDIVFSTNINFEDYQPIDPANSFENPLDTMFGTFSYDQMVTKSQWTTLWFRDGELLPCYETKPWDGRSGGFGYTDCQLPASVWLPGEYEVQLFVGETWKVSGYFTVTGTPSTPTISPTATITSTPTLTQTTTTTPTFTITSTLTFTPVPSNTPTPAFSPTMTAEPSQLLTPTLTITIPPTVVQSPTPTFTSQPTIIPTPTRRSTFYR